MSLICVRVSLGFVVSLAVAEVSRIREPGSSARLLEQPPATVTTSPARISGLIDPPLGCRLQFPTLQQLLPTFSLTVLLRRLGSVSAKCLFGLELVTAVTSADRKSMLQRYGFLWVTLVLVLGSTSAHWTAGWSSYKQEQQSTDNQRSLAHLCQRHGSMMTMSVMNVRVVGV